MERLSPLSLSLSPSFSPFVSLFISLSPSPSPLLPLPHRVLRIQERLPQAPAVQVRQVSPGTKSSKPCPRAARQMASGHAPVQVPAPHVPATDPHARPAGFFLLPRLQKLEGGAQTFVSSSRKDTLTCTRPRVPPRASALSPTATVPQQTFLRAQLVPRLNQRSPGLPLFKDSPAPHFTP